MRQRLRFVHRETIRVYGGFILYCNTLGKAGACEQRRAFRIDRRRTIWLARGLHRLRKQALALLRGAVILFAFQLFSLLRPDYASLATLPQFALLSSAMWTAGSVVLLTILVSHRPVLRIAERAQPLMRAFGWTLTVAFGALLVGVASDVFAALDIVSGSWTLSAAAAGVLMALAAWICW